MINYSDVIVNIDSVDSDLMGVFVNGILKRCYSNFPLIFLFSGVFPKLRSRKLPNLRVTWHFSLVQRRVKNGQTLTVKGMVKKWQNFISEVTNFSPWHPRRPWMYWNSIKIGRWCVLCRFAHVSLCQLLRRLWYVFHVAVVHTLVLAIKQKYYDANFKALLLHIN